MIFCSILVLSLVVSFAITLEFNYIVKNVDDFCLFSNHYSQMID